MTRVLFVLAQLESLSVFQQQADTVIYVCCLVSENWLGTITK